MKTKLLATLTPILLASNVEAIPKPAWLNQTLTLVYSWKWVDAAISVWTSYLGILPFYTIISAAIAGTVWVTTNSVIAAGITLTLTGIIIGGTVIDPTLKLASYIMILVGLAAVIYRLLKE